MPRHLARAQLLTKLAANNVDFDDRRALAVARQALELQSANETARADTRASTLEVLGLALLSNGDLAAAESTLEQAHALGLALFGPANRNLARAMGLWSSSISQQGEYARARRMLADEVAQLSIIDTIPARVAIDMLRARQLENEWLYGDLSAALTFLGPPPGRPPAPTVPRDGDVIAVLETRALLDAGRAAEAAARIGPVAARTEQRGLATGGWVRIAQTLAMTQLALGQPAAARETAVALQRLHAQSNGLQSWTAVVSAELAALAAARSGDARVAEAELAALEEGKARTLVAPSAVERAESAMRRAEVLQRTGHVERARSLASVAALNLQQQHPASPRLAPSARSPNPGR